MAWRRFEHRRNTNPDIFAVSLSSRHFNFNKRLYDQVVHSHPWVDLYFDWETKRVGMRFCELASDLNSYKVSMAGPRKEFKAPRISAIRFTRELGIDQALGRTPRTFRVQHETAEGIWWFSVAPLMKGTGAISRSAR